MDITKKRENTICSVCHRNKFKAILEQKNKKEFCDVEDCNFRTEIEERLLKPSIKVTPKPKVINVTPKHKKLISIEKKS